MDTKKIRNGIFEKKKKKTRRIKYYSLIGVSMQVAF